MRRRGGGGSHVASTRCQCPANGNGNCCCRCCCLLCIPLVYSSCSTLPSTGLHLCVHDWFYPSIHPPLHPSIHPSIMGFRCSPNSRPSGRQRPTFWTHHLGGADITSPHVFDTADLSCNAPCGNRPFFPCTQNAILAMGKVVQCT